MNCMKQKNDCCVCYERKDIIVSCKYCVEGQICNICYSSLSKYNQDDKCPCCRQEQWNNYIAKKTKVYPIIDIDNDNDNDNDIESGFTTRDIQQDRKRCRFIVIKNPITKIVSIVKSIWTAMILWMLGLFTLFIVGGIYQEKEPSLFKVLILPLLVGSLEILLILGCCCNKECKIACVNVFCDCDEEEN